LVSGLITSAGSLTTRHFRQRGRQRAALTGFPDSNVPFLSGEQKHVSTRVALNVVLRRELDEIRAELDAVLGE
jgi:hypothetical protein